MDLGLRGRVAAVAAASKGLGRACAEALAAEGCDVAVCARGEDALREVEKALLAYGVRVHAVVLDLNDASAPERFIDSAVQALGPVDIVVGNNGGPAPGAVAAFDDEAFRTAFEGNFFVTVRLARAALPQMRARGWGRVIAITSTAVKQPIDGLGLSNTARAAVVGWAKTLAAEVAREGVTVNVVAPGPFDTERMRQLGGVLDAMRETVPAGRVGEARELGDLVAFLASERAAFITGTTIAIDGGQVRSLL